jgi:ribosomal protein S18 acetylase RimI-like enzyme
MEVAELGMSQRAAGASLLAAAFVDYPAWLSIGPTSRRGRRRMLRRFYSGAIARAERWGGPVACATEAGRPVAVAIVYGPDRWPPPVRSFLREAWGVAAAGPAPAVRGLVASSAVDAAHPPERHSFLHTLGVAPAHQRAGAGRALMDALTGSADVRGLAVHLTTSAPENLAYYHRFGFRLLSESTLPRDVPLWSMVRPGAPVSA